MQIDYCLVFLLNALLVISLCLGNLIHLHVERAEETTLRTLSRQFLLLLLCSDLFFEGVVEAEHFRELSTRGYLGILRSRRQHLASLLLRLCIVFLVNLLAFLEARLLILLPLQVVASLLLLGLLLFYLTHRPIEDALLV